jgi:hypothetical protein
VSTPGEINLIRRRDGLWTRLALLSALAVASLAFAIVVAFEAVAAYGHAASDCHLYDVGNRLGLLLFEFPALTVVVWTTSVVPAALSAGRTRRAQVGLWLLGLVLASILAYLYLGTLGPNVRAAGLEEFCPRGVPDWWPGWLPR